MTRIFQKFSLWTSRCWDRLIISSNSTKLAIGAGLLIAVAAGHHLTGPEMSFGVFYLVPISFITWTCGRPLGVLSAFISAGFWLALDMGNHPDYQYFGIYFWNATVRLGFFVIVVLLLSRIQQFNSTLMLMVEEKSRELSREIRERESAEHQMLEVKIQTQRSIAHDLHDGLGQHLTGVAFKAKTLSDELAALGSPLVNDAEQIVSLVNNAISQTKRLAKGLDPVDVAADGLLSALTRLTAETEEVFGIQCRATFSYRDLQIRNPADLFLYRIAQEAVHNAIKHARPDRVDVIISVDDSHLQLLVRDNGTGFDVERPRPGGLGLRGMRQRALDLGGALTIASHPASGTEIRCSIARSMWLEEASSL